MKGFKEFLKDFKELNPKLSRSELEKRAKEAYNEEKKRYQEVLNIIKVPSIETVEKKTEKKTKEEKEEEPEPEKTQEELAEEKRIAEEKIEKELRIKNVQKLTELWASQLQRTIEGKPFPQFPLHPLTRRMVTPTDLYQVIDTMQEDEMEIEPPALLVLLIADQKVCIDCYKAFLIDPVKASSKLAEYFHHKNIAFHPEFGTWQSPMMPPLRREFITYSKNSCKQFMPRSIDLSEELKDKVIISPLDKIHSLHELIEKINKEPELLQKVTDHELQFFGIQTDKAMELRKIAGEKKQKRDKGLKEFIQNIIDANKEKEEKDTQSGGAATDINPNKVKRDLALYACMLI